MKTTSAVPEIHPAALLFPMMAEDELAKLAEDIKVNGLVESIVLYHGQVLDGRNRLEACKIAGVAPHFEEADGDVTSPTLYVLSKNLHRRHLTASQRGAIAAEVVPMLQEEARKRQGGSGRFHGSAPNGAEPHTQGLSGPSVDIAATATGAGKGTVQRALQVKRHDPALFEKIKTGEMTAYEARRTIDEAHVPKDERRKDSDGKSIPYQPNSKRQKQLANSQKERMVRALSTITGLCRGLSAMDVRKAVSACDEEERATWIERAKDLSSQLRIFAGKLQKGF